jgi:hypothetical protein
MGFSDSVKDFAEKTTALLEEQKARLAENAKKVLAETLGDDVALVKSASLNADIGKFYDIEAPEHVIQKLRDANLVGPGPACDTSRQFRLAAQ